MVGHGIGAVKLVRFVIAGLSACRSSQVVSPFPESLRTDQCAEEFFEPMRRRVRRAEVPLSGDE